MRGLRNPHSGQGLPDRVRDKELTVDIPDTTSLNENFAVPGHLRIAPGPGGIPVVEIANAHAAAQVALLGGHVLGFEPKGAGPVLWMSRCSRFELGAPIRGGIPVCWPWFGAHPTDAEKPNHGFARRRLWRIVETGALPDGATRVRLALPEDAETRALWPDAFHLEIVVTVGAELRVALLMQNNSARPVTHTCALHSYFSVSDITDVTIRGLEDCTYIDTVGPYRREVQRGPITFNAETDRVYLDTGADCLIDDPGRGRRIRVGKTGSRSTVVWNPWIEKAKRMDDFGDDEYRSMVCVETTNAETDAVTLAPGDRHRLEAVISSAG